MFAARALRRGEFRAAWRLSNENSRLPEPTDLALMKSLIAAAAAHELDRKPVARAIVESVIPKAKAIGSASILRDAYSIAAKVGGRDARLQRRARELSRLLTA